MNDSWVGTVEDFINGHGGVLFYRQAFTAQLEKFAQTNANARASSLLVNYKLQNGQTIPAILLMGDCVICFSILDSDALYSAAADKLLEATRLIANTHAASKPLRVLGAVVPLRYAGKPVTAGIMKVVPFDRLADYLEAVKIGEGTIDVDKWLNSVWLAMRDHNCEAEVAEFCDVLFRGQINALKELVPKLHKAGFSIYLSQDFEKAKAYCISRCDGNAAKRYGMIASSKARNLRVFGVDNTIKWNKNEPIVQEKVDMAHWFLNGPNEKLSCCHFDRAANERDCVHQKLDLSVLIWGDDLKWVNKWRGTGEGTANLRTDAYRTLMTASKEGCILFVPSLMEMEGTYRMLRDAGISLLQ